MEESESGLIFLVLFFSTFVLAIVEAILLWRWSKWYYASGLRVFLRESAAGSVGVPAVDVESLSREFHSRLTSPLVFRKMADGEYAFRESMRIFEFRLFNYSPIMHGRIVREEYSSRLIVEGRLNWFSLWFPCMLVALGLSLPGGDGIDYYLPGGMLAFVAVIYVGLYAIQRYRYNKVARSVLGGDGAKG